MQIELSWLLPCASLLLASPVLAEEVTPGGDVAPPVEGVEEPAATPTIGGYPRAEIDRPLVLPVMMLEARGGFTFTRLAFDRPFGRRSSTNSIGLYGGAGLGIVENLEAGIGGGFFTSGPGLGLHLLLSPEVDLGDLPLYGIYDLSSLIGVEGLEVAGRLTLNLPLASDFSLLVDTPVKYRVADMIALIGSVGLGAQLGDAKGLLLGVRGGALFQLTEQIAASATFGMLALAGDGGTVLLPLAVRGEFNVIEPLDAYVELSFVDLNNWGADWILIHGGVAYRLGL